MASVCVLICYAFMTQDQRLAAVAYARQHLAPWASQHMSELQRALATLALPSNTKVAPYKALFEEGQWSALLELFYKELYRMHCLLPESQLTVHLQVSCWQTTCQGAARMCRASRRCWVLTADNVSLNQAANRQPAQHACQL